MEQLLPGAAIVAARLGVWVGSADVPVPDVPRRLPVYTL